MQLRLWCPLHEGIRQTLRQPHGGPAICTERHETAFPCAHLRPWRTGALVVNVSWRSNQHAGWIAYNGILRSVRGTFPALLATAWDLAPPIRPNFKELGLSYPFPALMEIAQAAGAAVMQVYRSEFDVQRKSDASPLTEADLAAHEVIRSGLEQLRPRLPILSEESSPPPYGERCRWRRYWLVDPLDGTKEFIDSQRRIHGQHRLDRGWTGAPRRGRGACFGAAVHRRRRRPTGGEASGRQSDAACRPAYGRAA